MPPTVLTETIYQLRLQIKHKIDNGHLEGKVGRDTIKDLSQILRNLQAAELAYIRGRK